MLLKKKINQQKKNPDQNCSDRIRTLSVNLQGYEAATIRSRLWYNDQIIIIIGLSVSVQFFF
jgi:hypothetical protein